MEHDGPRLPHAQAIVGAALALLGAAPPLSAMPAMPEVPVREMTTDRPDTTETPFTVPAGRVQIETTLAGWTRASRAAGGGEAIEIGTTNLRIGLTPRLEAGLIVEPYLRGQDRRGAPWRGGPGAATFRLKLNLWGNDGGRTALGLMPVLAIPLDRSVDGALADIEYGLLVPFAIGLADGFDLGLNAGVTIARPERAAAYRLRVPLTASLGVALSETIGAFYEIAAELGERQADALSFNTGVVWRARPNLQLDAGMGFGLTDGSDRFAPFVGFSARF